MLENAARDESSIIEVADAIEPIEFAESHREEVELLEHIGEAVHEVEEGELTPEEAFAEIRTLIEAFEAAEAEHDEESPDEDHGRRKAARKRTTTRLKMKKRTKTTARLKMTAKTTLRKRKSPGWCWQS